jgi:hypothetical protein
VRRATSCGGVPPPGSSQQHSCTLASALQVTAVRPYLQAGQGGAVGGPGAAGRLVDGWAGRLAAQVRLGQPCCRQAGRREATVAGLPGSAHPDQTHNARAHCSPRRPHCHCHLQCGCCLFSTARLPIQCAGQGGEVVGGATAGLRLPLNGRCLRRGHRASAAPAACCRL